MDAIAPDVAAFILAGGKSARMGADKAFAELDSQTLLARALQVVRSVTADVRIVGAAARFGKFAPAVEDVFRGCGPLGGIHAALRASAADLNLMLAVDMPFVSPELLRYLTARARDSAALVTVPRCSGGWQPLCAVYRREFADVAETVLRAGRYKIDSLFAPERTQMIAEQEWKAAGFSADLFRNLNTPEELAEAGELSRTNLS
jgi:molybdopterin-guanine dinucleotide biosynthesis protein A